MKDFITLESPRDSNVNLRIVSFLLVFSALLSLGLIASQG